MQGRLLRAWQYIGKPEYEKYFTLTNLRYSSTFLPTGKSLILKCLTVWLSSMMKVPLKLIPPSLRTPYFVEISLLTSAISGMSISPNPPWSLDFLVHSLWQKCESIEQPTTSQLMSLNSFAFFEKSTISVGQTKVKSRG